MHACMHQWALCGECDVRAFTAPPPPPPPLAATCHPPLPSPPLPRRPDTSEVSAMVSNQLMAALERAAMSEQKLLKQLQMVERTTHHSRCARVRVRVGACGVRSCMRGSAAGMLLAQHPHAAGEAQGSVPRGLKHVMPPVALPLPCMHAPP